MNAATMSVRHRRMQTQSLKGKANWPRHRHHFPRRKGLYLSKIPRQSLITTASARLLGHRCQMQHRNHSESLHQNQNGDHPSHQEHRWKELWATKKLHQLPILAMRIESVNHRHHILTMSLKMHLKQNRAMARNGPCHRPRRAIRQPSNGRDQTPTLRPGARQRHYLLLRHWTVCLKLNLNLRCHQWITSHFPSQPCGTSELITGAKPASQKNHHYPPDQTCLK